METEGGVQLFETAEKILWSPAIIFPDKWSFVPGDEPVF